tara:strand:+ start:831 stop:2342 length:1512 start_codon:yes stop_codon:yes gene_type:complete
MAGETIVDRNILTIIEPALELDPLSVPDVESGTDNSDGETSKEPLSKSSTAIPTIIINGYNVQADKLKLFILNNNSFYPTCKIKFADNDALFTARHYPKDGDLIQVNIRSQGDETTFKPIRIDFSVVDCKPVGGGGGESPSQYLITGRMFVKKLFAETVEYQEQVTSWDALLNIAESMELGYASNVEQTTDIMNWTNPNDTTETWIQDIVANSYLSDETFFKSYIDPYYYLTMVDVNRLFSQEGAVEAMATFPTNASDTVGEVGAETIEETPMPYMLSNMIQFQGGSGYISKYEMVNKSGEISKANGYKRYTQYWDLEAKEWISEFVDPITNDTPGMVPATKGRIVNGEVEGPRNDQVKYKYLGTQGDNVHPEFQYATVQNYQNNVEIEKMGMVIELDTVNPSITRYSRIFCKIMEYAATVQETILKPANDLDGVDQEEGAGPLQNREGEDGQNDPAPANQNGVLNEFLTGFYVVSGVQYMYTEPGPLRMKLRLQRREYVPTT